MSKNYKLKDGTNVVIRLTNDNDIDKLLFFFQNLPSEDKAYLRVDVTDRSVVEQRLKNVGLRNIIRIVAEVDDEIIADGSLELRTHGWEKHVADLRIIVAGNYQRKGLGMLMAEELYSIALNEKVEEMVVKIMAPQIEAVKIFERLGFKQDVVMKDFVKDVKGQKQDLIILRCNLEEIWDKLESYFLETENRDMHDN